MNHINKKNKHIEWKPYKTPTEGLYWPQGQALPSFASPAEVLDALTLTELAKEERTVFTVLQGLINRRKPRIFLYGQGGEGPRTWADLFNLKRNDWSQENRYSLIKKYQNELSGVVLYSNELSIHYKNLACTIAGLKNALPIEASVYKSFTENGIDLKIVEDISQMKLKSPVEIYEFLYNNYWKDCSKRLFVSLNPNGDIFIRDIAAAAGCAVVWLDPRNPDEEVTLHKFLGELTAGKSQIIGWWPEERSGIGAGTKHGVSTIPSDFFENATVFAGMSHVIKTPKIPKKPELENKVYIAIFMSDGDNVQYCQHRMKEIWDDRDRGLTPINWTVSPGLADFAPAMLNYYYRTATDNDFFASGPSGLGYALIYDAHNQKLYIDNKKKFEEYLKLTEKYLSKSGIRVITAWDELRDMHMEAYASHCRTLYGVTMEDWFQRPAPIEKSVRQDRLAFIPNYPAYASNIEQIYDALKPKIQNFDGSPMFFSVQGVTWHMSPKNITKLKEKLNELLPGKIEILRGDHFFTLFNEANHLPFNLLLSEKTKVTNRYETIDFDFGGQYEVSRYVIRHAGTDGLDKSLNTKSFTFELSTDAQNWILADDYRGNSASITDIDIQPVTARYARLTVTEPGGDGVIRIGEVDIYGRV